MNLSIIIPCHNLEDYILPCIASLKMQKFTYDVEVVWVLDACTDNTKSIIEENMINHPYANMQVIETDYHNAGGAREEGRKYATGDYIWFVDGDDMILRNYAIETILTSLYEHKADLLQISWISNATDFNISPATLSTWRCMVWEYVFSTKSIESIHFQLLEKEEDRAFMEDFGKQFHDPEILQTVESFYFYNYMRKDSNIYKILHK